MIARVLRWLRAPFHRHSAVVACDARGRVFLKCMECDWRSDGIRTG